MTRPALKAASPWPSGPGGDMAQVIDAIAFAAQKHRHQRRKDVHASPYINHPIELVQVLVSEAGVLDTAVLVAAILHDTIEDTQTTEQEIAARFGSAIASVVLELTDDKNLPKLQRKAAQVARAAAATRNARLVRLADKICNLRDVADSAPVGWSVARCREYFDWARSVVDGMRGTHTVLEALFDEIYARRP
jgi:guanosine-3',5'-bis(diphosphate) 3'-pyrophosphohydrolase